MLITRFAYFCKYEPKFICTCTLLPRDNVIVEKRGGLGYTLISVKYWGKGLSLAPKWSILSFRGAKQVENGRN